MAKLHLSYDGNQNNGIVFNDTYTWGALYTGTSNKPQLSFQYDSMQATEVFATGDYVSKGGVRRAMTSAERTEVLNIADNWTQPLGQEGNPTDQQVLNQKIVYARAMLNATNLLQTVDADASLTVNDRTLYTTYREALLVFSGTSVAQNSFIPSLVIRASVDNKLLYDAVQWIIVPTVFK